MSTELLMKGVPVPLSELRSRERMQLTLGFFWRLTVWSLASALVGAVVTNVVAVGASAALSRSLAPEAYHRIVVPFTLLVGLVVGLVMTWWLLRLLLTGRYGALRLAVIRDIAGVENAGHRIN